MATTGTVIDSLAVQVATDLSELSPGLNQAQNLINTFAGNASKSLDLVAIASRALAGGLAAIGAGFTLAAIKAAADGLRSVGATADGIGITTAQLQELSHAARQAGIDHEGFNDTLKTFADRLKSAHDGSGELVDKLRDSDTAFLTTLRNTKSVGDALGILADHYVDLTDRAKKSELANAAFGADTEQLQRLLEGGSAGIKRMSDEAAGLGLVISDASIKTGTEFSEAIRKLTVAVDESAEAFGNTLKEGVVAVTPLLLGLVDTANRVMTAMNGISNSINTAFNPSLGEQITSLTTKATDAANALALAESNLAKNPGAGFLQDLVKTRQGQLDQLNQALAVAQGELARTTTGAMGPNPLADDSKAKALEPTDKEKQEAREKELAAQRVMNQELDRYNALRREGRKIIEENATPEEALADRQLKLNRLLENGAIDSETYGRAMQKATLVASNAYASAAASIAGDLGKVFENNKAVAIAQALINTYQSVTNAWANIPFPLNIAAAAASLAAGLAQVANIRSTTKSGGGSGGSGSGGSSVATATPIGEGQTLTVQGINPNDRFTGEQVRSLADQLLQFQRDGGSVILK